MGLGKWWYAAEEEPIAVYRQGKIHLVLAGIYLLLFSVITLAFGHPGLLLVFAPIVLRELVDGRKAIIFTAKEVIYRPPLASPIRVPFCDVIGFEQKSFYTTWLLRPRLVAGLVITLKNGEKPMIPLDFVEGTKIIERLEAATRSSAKTTGD
jgi:hypothetical protein